MMKVTSISIIVLSMFLFFSCSDAGESTSGNESPASSGQKELGGGQSTVVDEVSDPNVLQVAQSLPDFSTLVAAVGAAGVEDALVNTGPLTVFAPVNEAFDLLPPGTVDNLLKPENKSTLAFILTNHVAPANYPIKQLKKEARKGRKLYMASGKYLEVESKDDGMYVGGVKILKTVQVSNGWIHVIGEVLVPVEE